MSVVVGQREKGKKIVKKVNKEKDIFYSHRADAVLGRDAGGLVRVELVLFWLERRKRGEEKR